MTEEELQEGDLSEVRHDKYDEKKLTLILHGPHEQAPPPFGVPGFRREDVIERKYSFETPPPPIPASSIKKILKADVVVVGGGLSGMAAALSAAEVGAKVVLIEKTGTYQCRNGFNAYINTKLQRELGVEIDKDEVVLNLMKYGANKPDQRLLRLWANKSGEIGDWLINMVEAEGYEVKLVDYPPPTDFDNATEYYPQYLVTHMFHNGVHRFEEETIVLKTLMKNALEKGVVIHFNTRAKQLLRQGKGRIHGVKEGKGKVIGIIAQNADGEYIEYYAAKAVILCTGDYGNNSEMMMKYCPHVAYLASKVETSTGDGHQMALWIGAVMERIPHPVINHGFFGVVGNSPFLQVNIKGERFQNEDVPAQSYTNQVERQPGQQAWQVFDSKYPEEVRHMGIGHGKPVDMPPAHRDLVERLSVKADTIEELADKMKVPVETFKATVARYNELAGIGKDLDFGKRPDRLTTIDKPPYYACGGTYELLVTLGGVNVNPNLQPLDKDWDVIPGLFVAGNVVGNRFGVDYPTMCPGISHGMALVTGRTAGLNAATLET